MSPGPAKNFDPTEALEIARDLFWQKGHDAVGVAELERELGIGRKSLYDTFGNKRSLYLQALEQYTETVIARICRGLTDPRNRPIDNLQRVLVRLAEHHGSEESHGCLLGVAMGQTAPDDEEIARVLRGHLLRLEQSFEETIRSAQAAGEVLPHVVPLDLARHLVALIQGMALLGRVSNDPSMQQSVVRSVLDAVRTPN